MKKLLLLLIIPTISYSQITFNDVMSINSLNTFKRVVIENGFEFDNDLEDIIWYGIDIKKDSVDGNTSSLWGGYYKGNGEFKFQFVVKDLSWLGDDYDTSKHPYNLITEKIKKNCKFYDIIKHNGYDYSCYSCSESTYKGKIGFTKYDGRSVIRHIIPKKE